MRFGMVTTFYPPYSYGGDATYVRSLSESLVALGHEVEVLTSTDAYLVRTNIERQRALNNGSGVEVHRLQHHASLLATVACHQVGHPVLYSRRVKEFFKRPFDVIHFHNISLMGAPGILRMGYAKARLLSLHDHWLICPTHVLWKNRRRACDARTCFSCSIRSYIPPQLWRYSNVMERALRSIDLVLSPSEFTASIHSRNGIKRPIEVLPLFSAVTAPDPAPQVRYNRIVFVGRIVDVKGIASLVSTVARMPEIELIVIGDGTLREGLEASCVEHDHIRFIGKLEQADIATYYASAAAVVVPSMVPETFGLSVVEAAACGTPAIVAKGAGGAAELISNNGGGLLYDGAQDLEAAIRKLTQDHALRDKLGASAFAAYRTYFTKDEHLKSYLSVVKKTIMK